jgi:pSer/pThr/pTyr-binding forkhead associated (FHA) protein
MGELAYYIDWFPQAPVRLERDRAYRLGRGTGNQFFLPDGRASRLHAEILWNGQAFVLRDKGSANGTKVNGEKVIERVLKPRDQIEIGSYVLTLRVEDPEKLGEVYEAAERDVQMRQTVLGRADSASALAGTLAEIALSQVVQMLEATRKTGRLDVRGPGWRGAVWFAAGAVIGCEYASREATLADHEAFYGLMALFQGSFEFSPEPPTFQPRMRVPVQGLLMEAARRMDEKARGDAT